MPRRTSAELPSGSQSVIDSAVDGRVPTINNGMESSVPILDFKVGVQFPFVLQKTSRIDIWSWHLRSSLHTFPLQSQRPYHHTPSNALHPSELPARKSISARLVSLSFGAYGSRKLCERRLQWKGKGTCVCGVEWQKDWGVSR